MMYPAEHIAVTIDNNHQAVYLFIRDPRQLPKWASGIASGIRNENGDWVADSPMGLVKVRFIEENPFHIADHFVTLPNGQTVYNPLRVLQNGDGAEVVFSLFRLPGTSEEEYARDRATAKRDLQQLKTVLEQ